MKKTLLSAMLASAFVPAVAFAQAPAPATTEEPAAMGTMAPAETNDLPATTAAATDGAFDTVEPGMSWRFTELQGVSVYGPDDQSIGQVNDILFDREGQVNGVLVGVGGFLGIGEKNVAISMDSLQFADEVDNMSTAAVPADTTTAPATGAATTNSMAGAYEVPERIMVNVTREQLEAAPAYEDLAEARESTVQ